MLHWEDERGKGAMRSVVLAMAAAVVLCANVATAQLFLGDAAGGRPELTPPETLAKTWYRLAGKTPDFYAWAKQSEAWKNADTFTRDGILEIEAAKAGEGFELIVPGESMVTEMPVVLSDYSFKNGGFVVESLSPTTFIPFSHGGENFALVPTGLYELQWVGASETEGMAIDALRLKSPDGKTVTMTLRLAPNYAAPEPVDTGKGPVRVLAADILERAFYDAEGNLAWREKRALSNTTPEQAERRNDLLNLRQ
jgi:hypothetical protein